MQVRALAPIRALEELVSAIEDVREAQAAWCCGWAAVAGLSVLASKRDRRMIMAVMTQLAIDFFGPSASSKVRRRTAGRAGCERN